MGGTVCLPKKAREWMKTRALDGSIESEPSMDRWKASLATQSDARLDVRLTPVRSLWCAAARACTAICCIVARR